MAIEHLSMLTEIDLLYWVTFQRLKYLYLIYIKIKYFYLKKMLTRSRDGFYKNWTQYFFI